MLLHSLNPSDASIGGTASASQSSLQHLQGNLNTASGFDSILAGELSGATQPPLPGTSQPVLALPNAPHGTSAAHPQERELSAAEEAKIKTTAQQLESLMLYQMLKQMWESIPESSLMPEGSAGQMFREMWLEQIANKASEAGGGIGVAKVVERELTDKARHTFTPEQADALRQTSS